MAEILKENMMVMVVKSTTPDEYGRMNFSIEEIQRLNFTNPAYADSFISKSGKEFRTQDVYKYFINGEWRMYLGPIYGAEKATLG